MVAQQIIKDEVAMSQTEDDDDVDVSGARTVNLGGVFKCEVAEEDSPPMNDDGADLKSICLNVEWTVPFGPFAPGDLSNAGELAAAAGLRAD